MEYVDRRSVKLDIAIIARTVRAVLSRQGINAPDQATMHIFTGDKTAAVEDVEA